MNKNGKYKHGSTIHSSNDTSKGILRYYFQNNI